MTAQWLTYAALLKWRVVVAAAAKSSQKLREAMDTDAVWDLASMASTVREMKEMKPMVLLHVSKLEITRSWKCENVIMLTIAYFCEDMENFNEWSVGTEAIVESIDDDRDVHRPLLPKSVPQRFLSGTNSNGPRSRSI